MEEDIKNLSEIIELCEEEINNNDENVSAILDLTDLKSLRNLIKEYKNLKEIEENHRKENGELREQVKELEEDLTSVYLKGIYDERDKRIALVKEKIEELKPIINKYEKQIENDEETDLSYEEIRNYACRIQVLQELLEKRK